MELHRQSPETMMPFYGIMRIYEDLRNMRICESLVTGVYVKWDIGGQVLGGWLRMAPS